MNRALFTFAVVFLAAAAQKAAAERPSLYAGWETCKKCHQKIAEGWSATRHASAFDSLLKEHNEKNTTCVKCHSVGYGEYSGFMDIKITPNMAGVQCESCHGPSAAHAKKPKNEKPALTAPREEVCRKCHTREQDSDFNYAAMAAKVHGDAPRAEAGK